MMNKILQKIDGIIGGIPQHLRDIIQKAFLAVSALLLLIAIAVGYSKGVASADPGGLQLASNSKDLFYLRQIRAENAKRKILVEDISIDKSRFPSNMQQSLTRSSKMGIHFQQQWKNNLLKENKEDKDIEDDITIRKKDPAFLDSDLPFSNNVNNAHKVNLQEKELLKLKEVKQGAIGNIEKPKNKVKQTVIRPKETKKHNTFKFLHE